MRVSIIIPIFNDSKYIERCVRSVMEQTFSEIECIFVDNCSHDESVRIVERLLNEYNGPVSFRILQREKNGGPSAARNLGTETATGDYVYYLDGDDEITPDCIAALVEEVERHPGVDMVCADSLEPESKESRVYHFDTYSCLLSNPSIRFLLFCQEQAMPVTVWNKLISIDFIRNNKLSFLEGIIHEDVLWTYMAVLRMNTMIMLPQKTYIYHVNNESIVTATSKEISAKSRVRIAEEIVAHLEEPMYDLAIYKYLLRIFTYYRYLSVKDYQNVVCEFSKALWQRGNKRLSVVIRFYFRWNKRLHLGRFEKRLALWIYNFYSQAEKQARLEFAQEK